MSYFYCVNCKTDVDTTDETTDPQDHSAPCRIDGSINHSTCQHDGGLPKKGIGYDG